jgi:hypothetical protein
MQMLPSNAYRNIWEDFTARQARQGAKLAKLFLKNRLA